MAAANDYKNDLGGVRFHIGCFMRRVRIFFFQEVIHKCFGTLASLPTFCRDALHFTFLRKSVCVNRQMIEVSKRAWDMLSERTYPAYS